jgi:DHA1 family tetracycline resistance protein-like MFS transporter
MPVQHSKSSLFSLLPLYSVTFIGFVGYSLMITLFTPLMMQANNGFISAGSTLSQRIIILGILLALYPFGQFFGSPILGAFSDRFGRKPILIFSLCITTLCYIVIAWSLTQHNLLFLTLGLLIAGFAEANIAVTQSAIADVSTTKDRSRLFGYIYLSASSAYIIGPLLGGKLADPNFVSWFNVALPFWCVCGLLIVTIIWILIVFQETKMVDGSQKIDYLNAFTNLTGLFTQRKIRIYYLVNFLIYLSIFGFFRCYPMYLVNEFHMGVSRLSEFIAWVAVPIIFANTFITSWLAKQFSAKSITIITAFFTGIFMLLILVPHAQSALWVTLFLTGLALALCLPACATLLSISADQAEQGRVMGNNQALTVGSESVSALGGGLLAACLVKLPLIMLGIIAIIAGLVLCLVNRKDQQV